MGIQQAIQVLEDLRKKRLRLWRLLTLAPVGVLVILLPFMVTDRGKPWIVALIMIAIVILSAPILQKYQSLTKEFKQLYKNVFVKEVIHENLQDAIYLGDSGFSENAVGHMGLICIGRSFHSEDYLKAVYHGVEFEQADVNSWTSRSTRNFSGALTTIWFSGRILKMTIQGIDVKELQLYSKSFRYPARISGIAMKKVESADAEFHHMFDVKAADTQEALRLLTPQFMEVLKRLSGNYQAIGMFLVRDQLCLALSTDRNTFDPEGLNQEINYQQTIDRMQADIQDIKDLIDLFCSVF